ncbi:MAG: hypothetical protein WD016_05265 [Balneolaceae bacterium]
MATSKKNSKIRKDIEDSVYDAADSIQEQAEHTYDALIDRLQYEREGLERAMRHEYRNARRYVRSHPEQGLGIAFLAGLAIGIILVSSSRKD